MRKFTLGSMACKRCLYSSARSTVVIGGTRLGYSMLFGVLNATVHHHHSPSLSYLPYHDKNSVDTTLSDGGSNQLHHVAIAKMDLANSSVYSPG